MAEYAPLSDEITASLAAVWESRRAAFGSPTGADILKGRYAPFLCGGWIRDTLVGEVPRDIDLFFASPNAAARLVADMEAAGRIAARTPNAVTLTGDPKIQIVTRADRTGSPEKILEAFDFHCCQAAFWWEDDEWRTLAHPQFLADVTDKRLTYADPDPAVTDPAQSVVRAFNFAEREWTVPPETVCRMLESYRLSPGGDQDLVVRCRSAAKKENY